jgi:hypothetical protein
MPPPASDAESPSYSARDVWRFVFGVWLASRLLFLTAGIIGAHVLSHTPLGYPKQPPGTFSYWANWDGAWYSAIAKVGYARVEHGHLWPASANFFPFYPLLLRIGTVFGAGPALAGVLISLAASFFALYFAHELTRDFFDRKAARAATLALAFFPTAFLFNAVYTEAVFLAAALGSVWAARCRSDFVLAGLLGCVAAMTRNVGVLLLFPLAHEWFRRRRDVGLWNLASLALVPAGLLSYMFWLWRASGHPLLFSTVARITWGRTLTNPADTLHLAWQRALSGADSAVHPWRAFEISDQSNLTFNSSATFDYAFLLIFTVLVVLVVAQLPKGLALYAIGTLLLPVLTPAAIQPFASFSRYALAIFPAFFVLGYVLSRNAIALRLWLAASAVLGIFFTLYFTTWRWIV